MPKICVLFGLCKGSPYSIPIWSQFSPTALQPFQDHRRPGTTGHTLGSAARRCEVGQDLLARPLLLLMEHESVSPWANYELLMEHPQVCPRTHGPKVLALHEKVPRVILLSKIPSPSVSPQPFPLSTFSSFSSLPSGQRCCHSR